MDSAASRSMSGIYGRIRKDEELSPASDIVITGFNGTTSLVDSVGKNEDNMTEYYVPTMPKDLVLLCANDYAQQGAVILLPKSGFVLKLKNEEQEKFIKMIKQHEIRKTLTVKNRTYEVDNTSEESLAAATQYFNTKLNTSSVDERILAHLLCGFTLKDLISVVQGETVTGIHPEITITALQRFSQRWGSTPDAVQLAKPDVMGNKKGYMSEQEKILTIGQSIEMDFMESDYNDDSGTITTEDGSDSGIKRKRIKKLPTHGGAIAACVTVDCYSGYVMGKLVKSTAKSVEIVREIIDEFKKYNYPVKEFSADNGILTQSIFRVISPEVETYLRQNHIITRRSEPYNHSNGTPTVEVTIRRIKNLMGMAIHYILRNPNFQNMGYSKIQILKLWGELFYWAVLMINLKPCKNEPTKTKYEVFTKKKPNVQEIRLLPIFAHLMVLRYQEGISSIDNTFGKYYQYGLYVGPDLKVKGAIRAAVIVHNNIQIIVTTKYKSVSDGGGINPYPQVNAGLNRMLNDEKDKITEEITNKNDEDTLSDDTSEGGGTTEQLKPQLDYEEEAKPITNDVSDSSINEIAESKVPSITIENKNENEKMMRKVMRNIQRKEINRSLWPTREERMRSRIEKQKKETAFFADWNTNLEDSVYYSFLEQQYVKICDDNDNYTKMLSPEI
jgi:hypothetical protein